MTWTYVPAQMATNPAMQVRYLVGDTVATDQQVQDEEIAFALSQRPSIYGAAAIVCRALASQLSRQADTVDKDLRTTLSQRATAYSRRAMTYEGQAIARSGALPFAGGVSIADKVARASDPDVTPPQFNIGMTDNFIPVAPAGNEVVVAPIPDGDGDNV